MQAILPTLKCLRAQVETSEAGSVLLVQFNRPNAYNAISMEALQELHTLLDALQLNPSIFLTPESTATAIPRVVILHGAGRAFCAGVDVKAAERGVGGTAWNYTDMRSQQLLALAIEKIRRLPQPFIACLHGVASGVGAALALACDVRVAVTGTRLNASFVKLGLTGCDMGTSFFLPANLPLGIAAQLLLTGCMLDSQRALQLGLARCGTPYHITVVPTTIPRTQYSEVLHDKDEALRACQRLANDMLGCSPIGLVLGKQQLNAVADGLSLSAALTAENSHQMFLVNQPEAAQMAKAWAAKLMGEQRAKL